MPEPIKRQPVKNFLIMDRLQKKIIAKVLIVFSAISILTLLLVVGMYYLRYQTGYFYYMTEDMNDDLIRYNIWNLILPSAGPSLLVSILLGFFVSIYTSRIIALPLFKIKQWAVSMFAGNLEYEMTLRKGDDLFELETSCKQVSNKYNEILREIKQTLEDSEKKPSEKVNSLKAYLSEFKLS